MFTVFVPLFFGALLVSKAISQQPEAEMQIPPELSNTCNRTDWSVVTCVGNFNLSEYTSNHRPDYSSSKLIIRNSSLESISIQTGFEFNENFLFEQIYIENAPNLSNIDYNTIITLNEVLEHFYAVGTALPDYNSKLTDQPNIFESFTSIKSIYVGPGISSCPDASILLPCTCQHGRLFRTVASGLYGTFSSSSDTYYDTNQLTCKSNFLDGVGLRSVFHRIASSSQLVKHFDVVKIEGAGITQFPKGVLAGVSITSLWVDHVPNLVAIDTQAFERSTSIQLLQLENANFSSATPTQVKDFFKALSSLVNLRVLRLYSVGLPFIPNSAFVPQNRKTLHNLEYLAIAFDRRVHRSGVGSIGSYAFSGAPKLKEIGLDKNFIRSFEVYAFAFNQSRTQTLTVHIGGNPFDDKTGLKPDCFSNSRGPLQIKFDIDSFAASDPANDPNFEVMPENVFKPFLEEDPDNFLAVHYFNVEIFCDQRSKWMFDSKGILKPRVESGLRIIRVKNNVVDINPKSITCKTESSFHLLPKCLVFPSSELVHCGGNGYDVKAELDKLSTVSHLPNVTKLIFSAKEIEDVKKDAFEAFAFSEVHFINALDLRRIDPDALGPSTTIKIKEFSALNTSLTEYPNFARFPKLKRVMLDDSRPYRLNRRNFEYTDDVYNETRLALYLDNGTIERDTFINMANITIKLLVGKRRECSTYACFGKCKPTKLKFEENVFRPFLDSNTKHKIYSSCYLDCNCELEWIYRGWEKYQRQFSTFQSEYIRNLTCMPLGLHQPAGSTLEEILFGGNSGQVDPADYFKKECHK